MWERHNYDGSMWWRRKCLADTFLNKEAPRLMTIGTPTCEPPIEPRQTTTIPQPTAGNLQPRGRPAHRAEAERWVRPFLGVERVRLHRGGAGGDHLRPPSRKLGLGKRVQRG